MGQREIAVQSLAGGAHTPLLGGTDGRYAASGHIVFLRLGTLIAVPFDVRRQRLIGNAVPMVNDVAESAAETSTQTVSGAGQFAISDTGVLAFVRGGVASNRLSRLTWLDRKGRVTPVDMPPGLYAAPRLSPDGRRVAWFAWETTRSNIWIHDFERGASARLTSEDEHSWPIWSPDGREVTYQSVSGGEWAIRRRTADGTGSPTVLTDGPSVTPTSWSVDGKMLALTMMQQSGSRHPEGDLFTWRTGERPQPQPLLRTDADEQHLEFSPVSPHYAYVSDESGQCEVYVVAIERPEARIQVSANGGDVPVWSKSGRELVFVAPDRRQRRIASWSRR
jgi:WD40-like Beta Propeller Repeat